MPSLPNSAARVGSKRPSPGPLLLGLFLLAILAAIAIPLLFGYTSMMRGATSQTAQQVATAPPGAQAQVVLEVTQRSSFALLSGDLLQKNADGSYSHTGKTLQVQWQRAQVEMGSSTDVKTGAVLQISGVFGADYLLTAHRIVILTGVVQLK